MRVQPIQKRLQKFAIKNSPQSTSLEQFVHKIYEKITDVNELKLFALIENLKMLS